MAKVIKKRNWAFVLYPESAPDDWQDKLNECGLPFAISPLHDKDINANGEEKKEHYHIILCYPGPTTYNSVCSFTQEIMKSTIPQPLEAVRGYYRYFTHQDNPEKAQYDEHFIKVGNGFNIRDYIDMTKSEVTKFIFELQVLIRNLNIFEYSDLLDYLQDNDLYDYFDVATSHTIFLNTYITSRRHREKYHTEVKKDE